MPAGPTNALVRRLVQQKDAKGRVTQYQLDSFGRMTQTTWPSGRLVHASFAPGNLLRQESFQLMNTID